jgi:hypothetical protein
MGRTRSLISPLALDCPVSRAREQPSERAGGDGLHDRARAVPPGHERLDRVAAEHRHDVLGHRVRPDHGPPQERVAEDCPLRKALRLDQARVDGVDADAAAAQLGGARARERELGVLRRRVGARGRERDCARDRDDVDDIGRPAALESGQEGAEAPDRAEVVRAQHLLDPVGVGAEEAAPGRQARVVHEQADRGVARCHLGRDALDRLAARDVAHVRLAAELLGERLEPVAPPREQHAPPRLAREAPGDRRADPARRAGDDGDPSAVVTVVRHAVTVTERGRACR